VTATGKTVPNPRENLQIMLLEACQRVLSQIVPATPTLILESKLPKKLPSTRMKTAEEHGKFDGIDLIEIGIK